MRRFTHHPAIAWGSAGLWLALVVFLMLSPGKDSLAEDLSGMFGASEITDALGHVFLFSVLTALLAQALSFHLPGERAITVAAGFVLQTSSVLEPRSCWCTARRIAAGQAPVDGRGVERLVAAAVRAPHAPLTTSPARYLSA